MRVVLNYREGQKQFKKIILHPKSTLARPPPHDRAQPEILSTASPGNPVSIMKPSSLLLFVQLDKKFLEEPTKVRGTYFDNFRQKKMKKKIV